MSLPNTDEIVIFPATSHPYRASATHESENSSVAASLTESPSSSSSPGSPSSDQSVVNGAHNAMNQLRSTADGWRDVASDLARDLSRAANLSEGNAPAQMEVDPSSQDEDDDDIIEVHMPCPKRQAAPAHSAPDAPPVSRPVQQQAPPAPANAPTRSIPAPRTDVVPHIHPSEPGKRCPAPVKRNKEQDVCGKPVLPGMNYCGAPSHRRHDPALQNEEDDYENKKNQIEYFTRHLKKEGNHKLEAERLRKTRIAPPPLLFDILMQLQQQQPPPQLQ